MIDCLRRICELQPSYSSENTPAMQERGHLVRRVLTQELRDFGGELREALGAFGAEFDCDASDGIGRKTEAPWARFFARSMSPTPRDGFYVVLHFAADGSAVFVTLGCGSTIWANGDLRSESDQELARRTGCARSLIVEQFGSIEPFSDEIRLGARAALPRTFEKATAIARRIPVEALDEAEIRHLLVLAAERLRELYTAQKTGRHLTSSDQLQLQLEVLSRPNGAAAKAQGIGLSGPERKAVELRAMMVAEAWLRKQGYIVQNTSLTSPFDFRAEKDRAVVKVEVKGTTSDVADAIFMTRNEVELHRNEAGATGLLLVTKIRLRRDGEEPVAEGGELIAEIGWDIGGWDVIPIAYQLKRRSTVSQ